MTERHRTALFDEPGRTDGCPEGADQQPGDSGWVCTDHFDWFGETLHVAAHEVGTVGVWIDKRHNVVYPHYSNDFVTFEALREDLEQRPEFFKPPTDKEVKAAAKALERLLKEMTT